MTETVGHVETSTIKAGSDSIFCLRDRNYQMFFRSSCGLSRPSKLEALLTLVPHLSNQEVPHAELLFDISKRNFIDAGVRWVVEEAGADLGAANANGCTVAHWAASGGDEAVCRYTAR